ncbi:bifunctional riboflavin kinase/FAD synthetase [bacterium]|nr:bifunctional riboflavin kinase/FAD synthetase [bacterium]
MLIARSLDELSHGSATALTLGTFDGVHRGHRKIIQRTVDEAREHGLRSMLLTFDPHPREVIGRRGTPTYLLSTIDERIALLEDTGLDVCLVLPFTRDLSILDAATFFEEYIVRRLHSSRVVVGVDHAFGRGRSGTAPELQRLGAEHGVDVTVVGEMMLDGVKVSSTAIRHALTEGNVRRANRFLGRPYTLSGVVMRGEGIGRSLGFPTANLQLSGNNKLLPKNGVYIAMVQVDGEMHEGIVNIGRRPTVSKQMHISVEVHIFITSGDLYGRRLHVGLLDRLRDEIRFESREQLSAQIRTDIAYAKELLTKNNEEYNKEQFNFPKE